MSSTETFPGSGPGSGERAKNDAASGGTGSISASSAGSIFPCSFTQQRIWYAQQFDTDSSHWNVAMRWRIQGAIRDAVVERAWQILFERHEIFRTAIEEIDGIPHQRLCAGRSSKIAIVDLSRLPQDQRQAAAEEIARKDALTAIDLAPEAPLFRIHLIRLDDQTAYLLTNFHHIVIDGWSVGILIREFGEIVSRLTAGVAPVLPEPALQHVDYAMWQWDFMETGGFEVDREYWRSRLAELPRFEVPTDRPRGDALSYESQIRSVLLPRSVSAALNQFVRSQGCSAFQAATATLAAVLSKAASSEDVVLGTHAACRTEPELKDLVGPLVNTVVLRLDASGDPTLLEMMSRCRKECLAALEHQQMPFSIVLRDIATRHDPSRNPVYSISITTQAAHIDTGSMDDLRFEDLTISALPSLPVGTMMDLEFFMVEREEGWRLSCNANRALFDARTVDGIVERWAQAVELLCSRGRELKLSALGMQPAGIYRASGIGETASRGYQEPAALLATEGPDKLISPSGSSTVISIWKDLLLRSDVDLDTDFFSAGGHSLTAMRMISRVNKALDRKASLKTIYSHPRLGDFIDNIGLGVARPAAGVGAVAPETSTPQPPILALSNGIAYLPMARRLADRQRLVDVTCGTDEDVAFLRQRSYADLVDRVTQRIRECQPHGPYVLLGYCAVGQLAFDCACVLREQGEDIRLVALLDAHHPTYRRQLSATAKCMRFFRRVTEAVRNFRILIDMRSKDQISTAVLLEHYGFARTLKLTSLLSRLGLIDPLPPSDQSVIGFGFIDALVETTRYLAFEPQDLPIALFSSRDITKGWPYPEANGWAKYVTGRIEKFDVACGHHEMTHDVAAAQIGPHLDDLLRRLHIAEQ